jgi:hypothetical protein
MTLDVEARTEWTATGAVCWGGVLGAVAVIVHEVYDVLFSGYLIADPFLHVMTEMAVLVPGSAMVFVTIAGMRNWLLRMRLDYAATHLGSREKKGRA